MIIVREGTPGVFAELSFGTSIIKDGVQYPWQIVELWTDAELELMGIFRVAPVEPPEGKTIASYSIARVSGIVSYVPVFEEPEPVTEPTTKEELTQFAADKRFEREVGGILFQGVPIATDDRSKQMILGARVAADANPDFSTPWVAADESVMMVDATTMVELSNAVLTHVAVCFGIYASVKAQIDAGVVTSAAQITAAFA